MEHRLDAGRVDPEAAAFEILAEASHEPVRGSGFSDHQVAGVEPAAPQRALGRLGRVQVAGHDRCATNQELSRRARDDVAAVVVDDAKVEPRDRRADRPGPGTARAARYVEVGRLGGAETVDQFESEDVAHGVPDGCGEGLSRGDREAHLGERGARQAALGDVPDEPAARSDKLRLFGTCDPRPQAGVDPLLIAPVVDRLAAHPKLSSDVRHAPAGLQQRQDAGAELGWIPSRHGSLLRESATQRIQYPDSTKPGEDHSSRGMIPLEGSSHGATCSQEVHSGVQGPHRRVGSFVG